MNVHEPHHKLKLNDFNFQDLFTAEGLCRLDKKFLVFLNEKNPSLQKALVCYRETNQPTNKEISELLISCASVLEEFLAQLFNIEDVLAASQENTISFNPISNFKKYFVLKRAKKELNKINQFPPFNELHIWLMEQIDQSPFQADDQELAVALLGTQYLAEPQKYVHDIEKLVGWCARALTTEAAQGIIGNWTSFNIPKRIDYLNLVDTTPLANDTFKRFSAPINTIKLRDGFKLTDERMNAREVQDEVNYCIYCHDHDGDFCSKGFPVKKGDPQQGLKKNPLEVTLTGCPLEEKISEAHYLKKDGFTLASLAVVMIDNPMCPATGHRICNECMKACIYQKQEPVNIPQIETRILTDVLALPWGVEIYDLLTRWNPLRQKQWVMKPYNGLKIMIAGMGPAGFTLAHHLLLEGFAVVGFDGLKIEPLSSSLINKPIYSFQELKESLDERLMAGFGGVAEYGITVRWDKNFLKLIYLSLMRRPYFQVFGSVRFGGTLTIEDAWELGFDHFAVAVGAGLPKALPIPNSLAPGMRQANDFLMALQLGNAAKLTSLTNLQIRLPAVIIGGGLTGVDTATEVQAYYITQVEKILLRYEVLANQYGEDFILQSLNVSNKNILQEYLRHGQLVREERNHAKEKNKKPNFIKLIHEWGGVTIAYRKSMQESPAYINNHEELQKALAEGIYYAEGLEPAAVLLDEEGHCQYLECLQRVRTPQNSWLTTEEKVKLPARSILVATGTQPNTAYEFEHRGTFNRLRLQYQHYEDDEGSLTLSKNIDHCKQEKFGPFTSYQKHDKRVSLIGDTHPVFHGSVVKAIASGLKTYPKILAILKDKIKANEEKTPNIKEYQLFSQRMNDLFSNHLMSIKRKNEDTIELKIRAPLAAKHFQPGHFYRLQNFETFSSTIENTLLQMEPLALIAVEKTNLHELSFLVKEQNVSAKLCATLEQGMPVSLMGPTGVRAKVPDEPETVLIIGQASSFAFVRSYGSKMLAQGHRVIYLCQLNHSNELYDQELLEQATSAIIWQVKNKEMVTPNRHVDLTLPGDHLHDALSHFSMQQNNLELISTPLLLSHVDRIYVVGNTQLLRHFQVTRSQLTQEFFLKNPKVFGSVYGNMQCMLKGVCAQCLQWQVDPNTGARTKAVFACSWQDQPLELIDMEHLDERQMQNRLLEHLSNLWIHYLFEKYPIKRV